MPDAYYGLAPPPTYYVSYVDDLTFCIDIPGDEADTSAITNVGTILQTVCNNHHFQLNTKPGNTEATINRATRTSGRLRQRIRGPRRRAPHTSTFPRSGRSHH